jgi:hypothetical protein
MSSSDGMPVDVIVVDSDDCDRRVPGGRLGCLEIFLLNEDMVDLCCTTCTRSSDLNKYILLLSKSPRSPHPTTKQCHMTCGNCHFGVASDSECVCIVH